MEKVNCGFCGTAFSAAEEKCPVCGYPRSLFDENEKADILSDDALAFLDETEIPRRKNKPIFDYDEVNTDSTDNAEEEEDEEEQYEDEDEETGSNPFLVVILVILITLLLLATGFVFFRFFLPNVMDTEEPAQPSTEEAYVETEASTVPTIPCKMLALTSDAARLNREGQPWLLHVTVTPEDTTDELLFVSEDETVATVSEDGKIIAVGEGETVIKIICGEQIIRCPVVVDYDMVIDETEGEGIPTLGIEETEAASDPTETSGANEETQATESTQETEAETATEATASAEAILKIKETDISLSKVRGITYELTMDCDIPADQVEWITMNSNVLLVKNGVITVMGPGTTKVVAKYNGQSVECIVRCVF